MTTTQRQLVPLDDLTASFSRLRDVRIRRPRAVDVASVRPESPFDGLSMALDAVTIGLSAWIAGASSPIVTAVFGFGTLAAFGSYRVRIALSVLDLLPRLLLGCTIAAVAAQLLLDPDPGLASTVLVALAATASVALGRSVGYEFRRRRRCAVSRRRRTVIVGAGEIGARITRLIRAKPAYGLEPVALLDDAPQLEHTAELGVPIMPLRGDLSDFLLTHEVDTVIVAFSRHSEQELVDILRACDRHDSDIYVVPRLWEMTAVSGDMELVGSIPLSRIRRAAHRTMRWQAKLLAGRAACALLLLLLAPPLLTIATAVWLSDRSAPILFRQNRIGMDGRPFELLKFRTMRPAVAGESDTTWGAANADRVGRVGHFLRSTSLDELPQLWNVVRGDMTLIGPRPERPHFVEKFGKDVDRYDARHRVPTGLSGWAAVNGLRGDTSIADRVEHDNFYIENWSLWFDIKIALRTVSALVRSPGRL